MFKWIAVSLLCLPVLSCAASSGQIYVGRLSVHYELQGRGPMVMMLHGGYLDMHSWDREATTLAKNHTVLRIDEPGHGKTLGSDTTILIAEVLSRVLDSLHIRKTSLIGLSLGGVCALEFALAHPERVDKLVLVSSGLSGWDKALKLDKLSEHLFTISDSTFLSKDQKRIAEMFTHLWCDGPYRQPYEVKPSVRNYVSRTVTENVNQTDRSWPVFDPKKEALRVKNLNCPTLILVGDKDVPLIRAQGRYLKTQIKGAKLVIIKNSAHMINLEQPERFQRLLTDFL